MSDTIETKNKLEKFSNACNGDVALIYLIGKATEYQNRAFNRMFDNGIYGDDLYILYHECCNDDIISTLYIMTEADIADIKAHIIDKIYWQSIQ